VSEQPADLLQGRGETTQFVVEINQDLCVCVCVCWYDCIMDEADRRPAGPCSDVYTTCVPYRSHHGM
jgi:hypothetical protein